MYLVSQTLKHGIHSRMHMEETEVAYQRRDTTLALSNYPQDCQT